MSRPRGTMAQRHDAPRAEIVGTALVERELASIHDAIEKSRRELTALAGHAGETSQLTRGREELGAAIGGMEKATQQILKVTEAIDENARALCASLKDDFKRGQAQDIQEHAARIYEACNFQDISGQRITKAMAALQFAEERIARILEVWGGIDQFRRNAPRPANTKLVNGPKLESDSGHATQQDVDKMFA